MEESEIECDGKMRYSERIICQCLTAIITLNISTEHYSKCKNPAVY